MSLLRIEGFLKQTIGLDTPSIGTASVERAVRERMGATGTVDLETYWPLLQSSEHERQHLIEAVVVPETWFFRDPGAFAALTRLVSPTSDLKSEAPLGACLRILSVPCSTGEEPYSIAMALLDAGLSPSRFEIDAVDISERALEHARNAVYRKNSFRSADQSFRDRHFDGERLRAPVRERVRFHHANLFTLAANAPDHRYDVIFCRNLLIYFDRPTQDRAVEVLNRLLASNGVLFIGPSETALLMSHSFESTQWPRAFAFRAPDPKRAAPEPVTKSVAARAREPQPVRARAIRTNPIRPRHAPTAPNGVSTLRGAGLMPVPQNLLTQAENLADRGDLDLARECCESFLRAHEPSARAHYLMGLLEDAAGHSTPAIDHYRRAIYLDPVHEEALIHLATLIEQQGDQTAAKRLRDRARRAAARGAEQ